MDPRQKMCDTGHTAPKSPSEAGHPTAYIPRVRMAYRYVTASLMQMVEARAVT